MARLPRPPSESWLVANDHLLPWAQFWKEASLDQFAETPPRPEGPCPPCPPHHRLAQA